MQKDDRVYVGHMLDMAEKAVQKVAAMDRANYDEDENLRLALAHLIQTIGEVTRRVSAEFRQAHPEVPSSQVVGIRHKVVHDYMHVDYDILWGVATGDLPALVVTLKPLVS